jgi:hypothetical protein
MKIACCYIALLLVMITGVSCKKDNYSAPGNALTGRLVYKGEAVNVEYNQVPFEVYQYGFGKTGPITGTFAQDGSYSLLLFNGEYHFTVPNGQGPFKWKQTAQATPDTTTITVTGNQSLDLEVTPYYMIRNAAITAAAGKVSGSCKIEKIITDASAKDIEAVRLYINKTQFVSGADNVAATSIAGSSVTDLNNVNISVTIPALVPSQNYAFARIGIKIAGVEDMIFSPLVKIGL